MSDKSPVGENFQTLREQAEKLLAGGEGRGLNIDPNDLIRLAHELEVHQMELEFQNQELRRAKRDLEASRDGFADLYESAPVGYVTLNQKGIIEKANTVAHALVGDDQVTLGKLLSSFIAKDDYSTYYDYLNRIVSGESPGPVELKVLGPEGAIHVHMEATTQADGHGNLMQWRLSLVDISERKKAEETLFQGTFENAAVGMVHVSRKGFVVRSNQKLCDILGYSKEELSGKNICDLTHLEDLDTDLRLMAQLIEGRIDHYSIEK